MTSTATPTPTPSAVIVHVGNNVFDPREITIQVGQTVTWVRDAGFHSVTAEDGSFEQPAGSDWTTFSHTFTQAGEFPYFCSIHGGPGGVGMAGKVIVQASTTPTPTVTPTATPTPTGTAGDSHEIFLPAVQKP